MLESPNHNVNQRDAVGPHQAFLELLGVLTKLETTHVLAFHSLLMDQDSPKMTTILCTTFSRKTSILEEKEESLLPLIPILLEVITIITGQEMEP
jgi:hypothetical protein